ncbi:hypothetical protein BHE74_00010026, partial [Ensete ventricosum]
CDLIIIANGKPQKIASGLLTPFLAHLKFAQDQIAKGRRSSIKASRNSRRYVISSSSILWKKKHETGQWLEVEVAEAMSTRSEFSALNASGIIFAADPMMQNDHGDAQSVTGGDMLTETDGRAGICSEHES